MSVNRRFILKGVSLSGIAGLAMANSTRALTDAVVAPTGAAQPVLALVNDSAAEAVFVQGAVAGSGSRLRVQRVSHELGFMLELERRMRTGLPLRIIGLLDDAPATLVLDMARSAGARVQWLGQHSTVSGITHHHLLTTAIAEDCYRQPGYQLPAGGADFSLHEERINGAPLPRQQDALSHRGQESAQWAGSLGYMLASLGTRPSAMDPLIAATSAPVAGSFVSFLIEVSGSRSHG